MVGDATRVSDTPSRPDQDLVIRVGSWLRRFLLSVWFSSFSQNTNFKHEETWFLQQFPGLSHRPSSALQLYPIPVEQLLQAALNIMHGKIMHDLALQWLWFIQKKTSSCSEKETTFYIASTAKELSPYNSTQIKSFGRPLTGLCNFFRLTGCFSRRLDWSGETLIFMGGILAFHRGICD